MAFADIMGIYNTYYSAVGTACECIIDGRNMTGSHTASERRARITAEIVERTGIDEAMMDRLVRHFYAKIRDDEVLGPIFEQRISDWEPHLQRMCAFWSSVALLSGRYHGSPMAKHAPLPIDAAHFDRWIALFEAAAREICPPAAAAHFVDRARRIAESLELGVAGRNGVLLAPGERYRNDALHRGDR
jgi:hemoglobin